MTAPAPADRPAVQLPDLRQDLVIVGNSVDLSGQRFWKIYDPLGHRFVALSRKHIAMLQAWHAAATVEAIAAAAWEKHSEVVAPADVVEFAEFLVAQGLAHPVEPSSWRRSFELAERHRSSYLARLIGNYLFFKVPLVNPERFLRATLPFVRPLASRAGIAFLVGLLALDTLLLLREWDQFVTSISRLASWSGAIGIMPAVLFVKLLHELAHGYVATHCGSRVQSLGLAFMVGTPLLFVDVSDSWRVKSRRAHLMIDGAGIAMDLSVSILAAFAWIMLPDGLPRTISFNLATAGWLTSLTLNLNPFMRFDGYHLLADAVGMPNMQTRAMALARWRLREILFDFTAPPPEVFKPKVEWLLVLYGYSIWIYRAVVFTGIAVLVYAYFFKILGIALFCVEIGYFILGPLWRELKEWSRMKQRILLSRRGRVTATAATIVVLLLLVPWSSSVRIPAVLEPAAIAEVHVPVAARIVTTTADSGSTVAQGAPLLELASVELTHELEATALRAQVIDQRLDRLVSDATDREQAIVLRQERASLERKAAGLRQRLSELNVVAPIGGVVASVSEYATAGRWVTPQEALVVIHDTGRARIRGLIGAGDSSRVRAGMTAWFVPNDIMSRSFRAVVSTVADASVASIDQVALAQSFGGSIPTSLNSRRSAIPIAPQYQLQAEIVEIGGEAPRPSTAIGVLIIKGDAQSLLARVWQRVLMVLVRESGF